MKTTNKPKLKLTVRSVSKAQPVKNFGGDPQPTNNDTTLPPTISGIFF